MARACARRTPPGPRPSARRSDRRRLRVWSRGVRVGRRRRETRARARVLPGDVAPLVAKGEALQTRAETQRRGASSPSSSAPETALVSQKGPNRTEPAGRRSRRSSRLCVSRRTRRAARSAPRCAWTRRTSTRWSGSPSAAWKIGRRSPRTASASPDVTRRARRVPSRVAFVSARAGSRRRGRRGERRARLRVRSRLGAGPTERRVRRGVRRALSGRERDVRRDSRQRLAMRRMRARDHRRGRGPGGSAAGAVGRRVETRKNARSKPFGVTGTSTYG